MVAGGEVNAKAVQGCARAVYEKHVFCGFLREE